MVELKKAIRNSSRLIENHIEDILDMIDPGIGVKHMIDSSKYTGYKIDHITTFRISNMPVPEERPMLQQWNLFRCKIKNNCCNVMIYCVAKIQRCCSKKKYSISDNDSDSEFYTNNQ